MMDGEYHEGVAPQGDALLSAVQAVEGPHEGIEHMHPVPVVVDEGCVMESRPAHALPGIEWVDRGIMKEVEFGKMRLSFKGFVKEGMGRADVGSFVYLTPAEPNMPMFIGQVQDLFCLPREDTLRHTGEGDVPPGPQDGVKMGVFAWYSRPQELDIDAPLAIFEHEVFAVDDVATIPLDLVCGLCEVLSPKAFMSRSKLGGNLTDVFVCSRKYVPEEGRVVPLEGKEDEVDDGMREFLLVNKNVERNPEVLVSPGGKGGKSSAPRVSRRKRKERDPYSPDKPVVRTKGGRVVNPPKDSFVYADIDEGNFEVQAGALPKTPRSKYGRWTPERYHAAQAALVEILKQLGAVHPHKAILRPRLREEARRGVGDTGLLDYLLKHLADETVSERGEKLRRRHNRNGHMEYWLQDPESAIEEEQMLNEEMTALSAELREIREARNLIQTVRDEAAHAVKTIQKINGTPTPHEDAPRSASSYELPAEIQDALSSMRKMFESVIQQMSEETEGIKEQLETAMKENNDIKQQIGKQAQLIETLTKDIQALKDGAKQQQDGEALHA